MAKKLVVVESPAKANTIKRFLGKDYEVLASYGHVRDLAEAKDLPAEAKKKSWSRLGVDIEKDFQPYYTIVPDRKKHIDELKKAMAGKTALLLATDEDREGESISWHILEVLKPALNKAGSVEVQRIVFHEITPEALQEALANPRSVDEDLVRAQETRRILDRLYGFELSPVLWQKVGRGLSAGRVQSVATRLIVMRERERRAFKRAQFGKLFADLGVGAESFRAALASVDGTKVADGSAFNDTGELKSGKWLLLSGAEAESLATALENREPWKVDSITTTPGKENPPPPFMTSTLQQEASRRLGFDAKRTMRAAQDLYEGVDLDGERVGLITYMRTDSLNLAQRAIESTRSAIKNLYGAEYLPDKPNFYRSKAKGAQEAHEAIRPTDPARKPEQLKRFLKDDQYKLYDLIWKRTLACQMPPANVERTKVEVTVEHESKAHVFTASGKSIVFPGFMRAYVEGSDDPEADLGDKERILPQMKQGQTLDLKSLSAEVGETRPPARYTEASLVKKLEEEGVGRPSTYANILSTIQDRGYVIKKGKELVPTVVAFVTTQLLEDGFTDLVDIQFTSKLEEQLDEIADGKMDMVDHLKSFYYGNGHVGLLKLIEQEKEQAVYPAWELGKDENGKPVVVKTGKNGPYIQRGEGDDRDFGNIPADLTPDELSLEKAIELIEKSKQGPEQIATHTASGKSILLRSGRFGEYFEVADDSAEKPLRASVPPDTDAKSMTEEQINELLSYPKTLGNHPETGEPIVVAIGRYGAYLTCGSNNANIGDWKEAGKIDIEGAVTALAEKRSRTSSTKQVIKEIGALEGIEGDVQVLSGRYGPYVSNGKVHATIPRGTEPESVDADTARRLILEKIAKGPTKRKGRTRTVARKKK